jgi:hypothetical protein
VAEVNGQLRELVTAARAFALGLQTDTCTITRAGGRSLNTTTGVTTYTSSEVYSGACRLRPRDVQDRIVDHGGEQVSVGSHVLSLPITVTTVEPGDTVALGTSVYDGDLSGRTFTVVGVLAGSQVSARRISVQEAT